MCRKLFILFLICFSTQAFACTCISEKESLHKKVTKAFHNSEVIFTANLIAKKVLPLSEQYTSSADPVLYTFQVINAYKNTIENKTIEIVSVKDGASCGYFFEVGKTYLVYARATEFYSENKEITTPYTTGICDRNQTIRTVKKRELKKLNQLKNS